MELMVGDMLCVSGAFSIDRCGPPRRPRQGHDAWPGRDDARA
jgi:hypothetical protein